MPERDAPFGGASNIQFHHYCPLLIQVSKGSTRTAADTPLFKPHYLSIQQGGTLWKRVRQGDG
jgi:hypothetical protein